MADHAGGRGKIASDALYTVVGGFIIALVTLLTVPAYLSAIGQERYGILVIFWTVLTTLSLLDLGVSGATTQRMAAAAHVAEDRDHVFWTSMAMNAVMGILGAVLVAVMFEPIARKISFSSESARDEFIACWPIMVAIFPLAMIRNIVQAAMVATSRFKALAIVCVVEGVAVAVVPLLLAHTVTIHVPSLLLSIVILKAMTLLVLMACYSRATPDLSMRAPQASIARSLFGFGAWATVSSAVAPVFVTFDRFLIATLSGVGSIPAYSVSQSVTQHMSIIPRAFASVLFPRFSADSGVDALATGAKAIEVTNYLMVPISIAALIGVEPFLHVWIGAEFAETSRAVAAIFILGAWLSGLGRIPHTLLYGRGLPDKVAKIHVSEVLPFVVLLYAATTGFGIEGAAMVVLLRTAVDTLLIARCAGLGVPMLRLAVVPAILLSIGMAISLLLPLDSVVRWVLAAGLLVGVLVWFVLGAPKEIGQQLVRYLPLLKIIRLGTFARAT